MPKPAREDPRGSKKEERQSPGDPWDKSSLPSWALDRYRFLRALLEAYRLYPAKKWSILVEADTFLHVRNLLLWIEELERSGRGDGKVYAGAQMIIDKTEFGHGGGGTLVSAQTLQALAEYLAADESRKAEWEKRTKDDCCGDKILSEALAASSETRLLRAFPHLQGETPESLDWSRRHWCRGVVSWHHVMMAQVNELWHLEREWGREGKTMRFRDVFEKLVKAKIRDVRRNWDNLSGEDIVLTGGNGAGRGDDGWKACRDVCEERSECVQWLWKEENCRIDAVVRLGSVVLRGEGSERVSGWMLEKIDTVNKVMDDDPTRSDDYRSWITDNEVE